MVFFWQQLPLTVVPLSGGAAAAFLNNLGTVHALQSQLGLTLTMASKGGCGVHCPFGKPSLSSVELSSSLIYQFFKPILLLNSTLCFAFPVLECLHQCWVSSCQTRLCHAVVTDHLFHTPASLQDILKPVCMPSLCVTNSEPLHKPGLVHAVCTFYSYCTFLQSSDCQHCQNLISY